MRDVETAIIGGGPAGAAAACALAASGRETVLFERSAGPHHKVCGEFLSIETQALLREIGIDPPALGAVGIDYVAIYAAGRSIDAALPFRALSLSRHRLDDALLHAAAASGAEVRRNTPVREVSRDGAGWTLRCEADDRIRCRHLVLATGKRGLRGISESRDASLVGLKMHLRLAAGQRRALTSRVELAFLAGGYAGLEPVENDIANLCFVLPRALVARLAPGWPALQTYLTGAAAHLAERLEGAEPLWEKPLAVVCPSGGHLHRTHEIGAYRVGDRLAHIPPFTGDGLAIALGSAALAARHIAGGKSPAAYQAAARRLTASPIRVASTVSGLAGYGIGRAVLMRVGACAPGLIGSIVRRTRMVPGLPSNTRTVS